uniref:Phospholipid scramblase n=1 Tax=Anolis carolinensis TaxID=28377 RepID=H9G3M9_ANOCA
MPRSLSALTGGQLRPLESLTNFDVLFLGCSFPPAAFIGFERNNMYEVRNNMGHPVFHCAEQNDWLTRNLCGSLRRFSLRINDPSGCEVMRVIRPMKCSSCWFPCCLQQMEVQCPPGNTIGFVEQTWHAFQPKFSVQNVEKETLLRVVGPTFVFSCGGDVNFEVWLFLLY